jgi:hypothetical protein
VTPPPELPLDLVPPDPLLPPELVLPELEPPESMPPPLGFSKPESSPLLWTAGLLDDAQAAKTPAQAQRVTPLHPRCLTDQTEISAFMLSAPWLTFRRRFAL